MSTNCQIIDNLECYLEELVDGFQDFVKKSLIAIAVAIASIVLLFLYMINSLTERNNRPRNYGIGRPSDIDGYSPNGRIQNAYPAEFGSFGVQTTDNKGYSNIMNRGIDGRTNEGIDNSINKGIENIQNTDIGNSKTRDSIFGRSQSIDNSKIRTSDYSRSRDIDNSRNRSLDNSRTRDSDNSRFRDIDNTRNRSLDNIRTRDSDNSRFRDIDNSSNRGLDYTRTRDSDNIRFRDIDNSNNRSLDNSRTRDSDNSRFRDIDNSSNRSLGRKLFATAASKRQSRSTEATKPFRVAAAAGRYQSEDEPGSIISNLDEKLIRDVGYSKLDFTGSAKNFLKKKMSGGHECACTPKHHMSRPRPCTINLGGRTSCCSLCCETDKNKGR